MSVIQRMHNANVTAAQFMALWPRNEIPCFESVIELQVRIDASIVKSTLASNDHPKLHVVKK